MTAMNIVITENEIVAALAEAARGSTPDEARTVTEMSASTGFGTEKVRKALKQVQATGRLTVHQVKRVALDGALRTAPAYTILPAKKKG